MNKILLFTTILFCCTSSTDVLQMSINQKINYGIDLNIKEVIKLKESLVKIKETNPSDNEKYSDIADRSFILAKNLLKSNLSEAAEYFDLSLKYSISLEDWQDKIETYFSKSISKIFIEELNKLEEKNINNKSILNILIILYGKNIDNEINELKENMNFILQEISKLTNDEEINKIKEKLESVLQEINEPEENLNTKIKKINEFNIEEIKNILPKIKESEQYENSKEIDAITKTIFSNLNKLTELIILPDSEMITQFENLINSKTAQNNKFKIEEIEEKLNSTSVILQRIKDPRQNLDHMPKKAKQNLSDICQLCQIGDLNNISESDSKELKRKLDFLLLDPDQKVIIRFVISKICLNQALELSRKNPITNDQTTLNNLINELSDKFCTSMVESMDYDLVEKIFSEELLQESVTYENFGDYLKQKEIATNRDEVEQAIKNYYFQDYYKGKNYNSDLKSSDKENKNTENENYNAQKRKNKVEIKVNKTNKKAKTVSVTNI